MDTNILVEFATSFLFCTRSMTVFISVVDIEDKVIHRCQVYSGEQESFFFPTSIQNAYSLEAAFSCKRLYISFCIFALFLYYRKVLS